MCVCVASWCPSWPQHAHGRDGFHGFSDARAVVRWHHVRSPRYAPNRHGPGAQETPAAAAACGGDDGTSEGVSTGSTLANTHHSAVFLNTTPPSEPFCGFSKTCCYRKSINLQAVTAALPHHTTSACFYSPPVVYIESPHRSHDMFLSRLVVLWFKAEAAQNG